MEKITKLLRSQVQTVQEQLQGLLEHEDWSKKNSRPFEVTTDLSHLSELGEGLEENFINRVPLVFSRLTPYFDAGLLLSRRSLPGKKIIWIPAAAFHNGVFFPLEGDLLFQRIILPTLRINEIKRSPAAPLLKSMKFEDLLPHPEASAFALRVSETFSFLLITKLAEPWLKIHMESIHQQIGLLLADQL